MTNTLMWGDRCFGAMYCLHHQDRRKQTVGSYGTAAHFCQTTGRNISEESTKKLAESHLRISLRGRMNGLSGILLCRHCVKQ